MYDIIQFHNQFNNAYPEIPLTKNEDKLLNLLFLNLQGKSESTVSFSFDYIADQVGLVKRTPSFVYDFLKSADSKFKQYQFQAEIPADPEKARKAKVSRPLYIRVSLFPTFGIDPFGKTVTVGINKDYEWLVNGLLNEYTAYFFSEYKRLHSPYAQILFRQIKRWRTVGKLAYEDMESFRQIFGVPEGYRSNNIMARIILPAVEEIQTMNGTVQDLKVTPLYKGRSHALSGFQFTWSPEKRNGLQEEQPKLLEDGLNKVLFSLNEQVLTQENYDLLVREFPKEAVDHTIQRILKIPYIGCLEVKTIRKWCQESLDRKTEMQKDKNTFCNFKQREYDWDALEDRLMNRTAM